MAVAPLNNLNAQPARQPIGGRPESRPASFQGARLGADATRLKPRAASTMLPQAPAKFLGPEDFKAYVELVVAATQARRVLAAGPKATLDAAEAAVQTKDTEIGTSLQLAHMGYMSTRGNTAKESTELDAQVDRARQALEAARNPGRAQAAKLNNEVETLHHQLAAAEQTVAQAQSKIDSGEAEGQARAAAYAAIAMGKHTLNATREKLAAKGQELAEATARMAPEYDPMVTDARNKLQDAEARRDHARKEADTRLAQMKDRLDQAQRDYDQQLAPLQQELTEAQQAYAPLKSALDQARNRLATADASVTKTQRALWWAKGFNLGQYLAEQVRATSQD